MLASFGSTKGFKKSEQTHSRQSVAIQLHQGKKIHLPKRHSST